MFPAGPTKVSFQDSSKSPLSSSLSSQRPEQGSFKAAEADVAQCGLHNLPDTSPPKWFRWSTPSAHASSPLMPDRRRRSPHAGRWATDPVQKPTPIICPTGPVSPACIMAREEPIVRRSWSIGSISAWTLSCSITQVATSTRALGTY